MTTELKYELNDRVEDVIDEGAGYNEKTERVFDKHGESYGLFVDGDSDVEELVEMTSDVLSGVETYHITEVANTMYSAVDEFVNEAAEEAVKHGNHTKQNSLFPDMPNKAISDPIMSTGRVVMDCIATLYDESDGRVHDAIFDEHPEVDSSEEIAESYAEAILGEPGESEKLLSLANHKDFRETHADIIKDLD